MDLNSRNLKLIIGTIYSILLFTGLFFLFSAIDLKDLTNYDFIRSNRDIIFEYKQENFFCYQLCFFIFCIVWVLFLGFAMPLLIFAGFVFGKWIGFSLCFSLQQLGLHYYIL